LIIAWNFVQIIICVDYRKGKAALSLGGRKTKKKRGLRSFFEFVRRADRELAPKGDMKNDRRKWE
jgi:hypothetical protein